MSLQAMVYRRAAAIGVLTEFVGKEILARGLAGTASRPLIRLSHPPIAFPMPAIATRGRGGFHLLMFGRLLTYKGLDLLTGALTHLGPRPGLAVRVVGTGPESTELKSLRALPGVIVENRWVPEDEIGALLAWSDAVILPYREASQSGVAAAALAAGRWVVATRVGGLPEQLSGSPRAVICEPDVTSLATGLHHLMNAPRVDEERSDDHELAWRRMAELLVEQVNHLGLCHSGETPSIVSIKQPHSL
jgi:glycosyltransferase involved in cell wall biosynthesis